MAIDTRLTQLANVPVPMAVILLGMCTETSRLHPRNMSSARLVMVSGKTIRVRLMDNENVLVIRVTVGGITTVVSPVFRKAALPNNDTESGKVMEVKLVHSAKEKVPIVATVSGMVKIDRLAHAMHRTTPRGLLSAALVNKSPNPRQLGSTVVDSSVVTEFGSTTRSRLWQRAKRFRPRKVTPLGTDTCCNRVSK